jgi:hypothetical protein
MLSHDDVDAIARVVVAREAAASAQIEEAIYTRAYECLLAVKEAQLAQPDAAAAEEWDRGQAVEQGVRRLIREGCDLAWPLLVRIVGLCPPDREILQSIGAGLFEDWVSEDRVAAVVPELEALLRSDPRWRVVTESSWDEPPSLARLLADPRNLPSKPL